VTLTTASCPRCGTAAAAEASRCEHCGFVFFELPERRSLPRPRWRWIAAGGLALAAVVVAAMLLSRDPEPEPPGPVPAARAERRLERQLAAGPSASVRCPGPIEPGHSTRCQFIYPDGDTQLMLVSLARAGELEIDVPYPAQRRPGR
jgi:ribosomal protein L37E